MAGFLEPAARHPGALGHELFEACADQRDFASRTARSGLVAIVSQVTQALVQGLGLVVLARLLTPADYGLFGIAGAVAGFAQVFRSGGLTVGTVQRDRLTHEQLSTVFWVNVAILLAVAAGLFMTAPFVAGLFGYEALTPMVRVLAAAFFINGISVQHEALLRRQLRFLALSAIQVAAVLSSVTASIALAVMGQGQWALVGGITVAGVVSTTLSFGVCRWVPGRPRLHDGFAAWLRQGAHITAFDVCNYFARTADNLLIGRYIGAAAAGLYTRAYALFMLPVTQIRGPLNEVALPVLSALKNQPERFRRYYLRMLGVLAYTTVPISVYCVLEGGFVVGLLLGPQWVDATPIFRVLSAVGAVQTVASTRGLVMLSRGDTLRYSRFGVFNSFATVAAFVAGLPFGILGVAVSYALVTTTLLVPTLNYAFLGSPLDVIDFFKGLVRPLAFSAAGACAAVGAMMALADFPLAGHISAGVAFFGVYGVLAWRSKDFRSMHTAFLEGLNAPLLERAASS